MPTKIGAKSNALYCGVVRWWTILGLGLDLYIIVPLCFIQTVYDRLNPLSPSGPDLYHSIHAFPPSCPIIVHL